MGQVDVYLVPPDIIFYYAAKTLMAAAFQTNAAMLHIQTKSDPVESTNSMTSIKRLHSPIRQGFSIIFKETSEVQVTYALQMAVKAINDSVDPTDFCQPLFIFGASPRLGLSTDWPATFTYPRASTQRKETSAMSKHFTSRQLRNALKMRNSPDLREIHQAPIGYQSLCIVLEKPNRTVLVSCSTLIVKLYCTDYKRLSKISK